MAKNLKKLDLIIIENEVLVNKYRTFYKLDNVEMLTNFAIHKLFLKNNLVKVVNSKSYLLLEYVKTREFLI